VTTQIRCPNGHKVNDNPTKHQSRNKYCPTCRAVYRKQPGFNFNLNWIREKLDRRNEQKEIHIVKIRGNVAHNLRLNLDREPTNNEIEKEVQKRLNDEKLSHL
jgi:hypothetical protein